MPKFKAGDLVWFRDWTGNIQCGRVIRYWKGVKTYTVQKTGSKETFNEIDIFKTEEEAREKTWQKKEF